MNAINLRPFCRMRKFYRYPAITKPFRIGNWLYATDGFACVRVPATDEPEPTEAYPRADVLFQALSFEGCIEPWPQSVGDDIPDNFGIHVVAHRRLTEISWFRIWQLGDDVLFDPSGDEEDSLKFVCGELQGIVLGLRESRVSCLVR